MKIIYFFLFVLSANFCVAQCPQANVLLTNQNQINNFQEHYPNCTNFSHSIFISDPSSIESLDNYYPINNLNGLSHLKTIGGDLIIDDNRALTNLGGLENLKQINGSFIISNNLNLESLCNDGKIIELEAVGEFTVSNNMKLMGSNNNLEITKVKGNVSIDNNNALDNFDGFLSVAEVDGDFTIVDNENLLSFCGINRIRKVGYDIIINNNPNLHSIEGLHKIRFVEGEIVISNNQNLDACCQLANWKTLSGEQPDYELSNNGINCSNESFFENCSHYILPPEIEQCKHISFAYKNSNGMKEISVENMEDISFTYEIACGETGAFTGPAIIETTYDEMTEMVLTNEATSCKVVARLNGGGFAIDLLRFEGESTNNGKLLKWVTASETDNDYFSIFHATDGINFEEIARVSANGNTSTNSSYTYFHLTNEPTSYYCLDDIDVNGINNSSFVIKVEKEHKIQELNISPVPANNVLNVEINNQFSNESKVLIFDIDGQLIKTMNKLENNFNIDISDLKAGIYLLQIQQGAYLISETFLVD